jgi:hypothetical protein
VDARGHVCRLFVQGLSARGLDSNPPRRRPWLVWYRLSDRVIEMLEFQHRTTETGYCCLSFDGAGG